jgi:YbbR domain-containing protein
MMRLSVAGVRLGLSFLAALALWGFVTVTQNPEDRKIYEIPIDVKNMPVDAVIIDANGQIQQTLGTIQVEVWAAKNTLSKLRDGDIEAVVDLTNATAALQKVPIVVTSARNDIGYMTFKYSVQSLDVRVDMLKTITVPVVINSQQFSSPGIGVEVLAPTIPLAQQTVSVYGPQTLIKRIKEARVNVDINGSVTASYTNSLPVALIDSADKPINGLTITPDKVDVSIEIKQKIGAKEVVVLPRVTGFVAAGFRLREVRVNPLLVSITGSSQILEKTNSVQTLPIDINNLTKSVSRTVEIDFPEGILALDVASKNVDVGLEIEQTPQFVRLKVPVVVTIRDMPSDIAVRANPAIVMLDVVVGASAMLRGSVNFLVAEVSVGAWEDGNMMRQVQLSIPEDIRLMSDVPVVQLERVDAVSMVPTATSGTPVAPVVPVATAGTVVATPVALTPTIMPGATGTIVATATKIDN